MSRAGRSGCTAARVLLRERILAGSRSEPIMTAISNGYGNESEPDEHGQRVGKDGRRGTLASCPADNDRTQLRDGAGCPERCLVPDRGWGIPEILRHPD